MIMALSESDAEHLRKQRIELSRQVKSYVRWSRLVYRIANIVVILTVITTHHGILTSMVLILLWFFFLLVLMTAVDMAITNKARKVNKINRLFGIDTRPLE
jgi:hypothetical protein